MLKKTIALGFSLLLASSTVFAIDGYKGAKFGASFEDFKKAKLCTWKKYDKDNTKGMQTYYCEDFSFSGNNELAFSFFINGGFKRLAISLDKAVDISIIIEGLKKKYGEPSSSFTAEDVDYVKKHGGSLDMKFDNDTIIIGVKREPGTMQDSSMLTYSSPDYFKLLGELDKKNLDGDL